MTVTSNHVFFCFILFKKMPDFGTQSHTAILFWNVIILIFITLKLICTEGCQNALTDDVIGNVIRAGDSYKITVLTVLDFSKAFDTVDYKLFVS